MQRKKTCPIKIGNLTVGGTAPVSVQSMTNTDTRDITSTVKQIKALEAAGCEIVRVAVPDHSAAEALKEIKKQISIPLVADIHFDYRLALVALENGVDGLRINPGNIGESAKVRTVVQRAKERRVPIRIGVNAGSLEKSILHKYGRVTAEAMVESALNHIHILEELDFYDIVVSIKASDVPTTIRAYELMSDCVDYPLHLGVTEAGTTWSGSIKSAVGIGALLAKGIGDTIRVSLTGDPIEEVRVGFEILKALGLRQRGPVIVSCPTCGRCEINLIKIAKEVERKVQAIQQPLKIAIMGCVVNGPGEAREADIGIAGGKGVGILFRHGEIIRQVNETELVNALMEEISSLTGGNGRSLLKN